MQMKPELRQFVRFGIIGVVNTLFDLLIYTALIKSSEFFEKNYLLAGLIAFLLATMNSFYWNKHWTFEDKSKTTKKLVLQFYIAASSSLLVNELVLGVAVSIGVGLILSKLIASGLAAGTNFFVQRFWTFAHIDTK